MRYVLAFVLALVSTVVYAGGYCAPGFFKPAYGGHAYNQQQQQAHYGGYYGAGSAPRTTYQSPTNGEIYAAATAEREEAKAKIQRDMAITFRVDAAVEKGSQAEREFYEAMMQRMTQMVPMHKPMEPEYTAPVAKAAQQATIGGELSQSCIKCHSVDGSKAAEAAYYRTVQDIWADWANAYDAVSKGRMPLNRAEGAYTQQEQKAWITEISP